MNAQFPRPLSEDDLSPYKKGMNLALLRSGEEIFAGLILRIEVEDKALLIRFKFLIRIEHDAIEAVWKICPDGSRENYSMAFERPQRINYKTPLEIQSSRKEHLSIIHLGETAEIVVSAIMSYARPELAH